MVFYGLGSNPNIGNLSTFYKLKYGASYKAKGVALLRAGRKRSEGQKISAKMFVNFLK